MTHRHSLAAFLLIVTAVLVWECPSEAATAGWRRLDVAATGRYALRYLPASIASQTDLPVIVFLHGSGATPESWQSLLAPLAEELGFVALLPKSDSQLGFGPGDDAATVDGALVLLKQELAVDEERIGLAGHSSGGAYAAVLAYQSRRGYSGVFLLSSPYRIVLSVADAAYRAPLRMYYGTDDPNFQGGARQALVVQWQRLGVAFDEEIRAGFGHSSWPDSTLPDGFRFLLAQRYRTVAGCVPTAQRLCLQGGRFAVEARWRNFRSQTGAASAAPLASDDAGVLWFFRETNWEMLVKVLNGCANNGHFWVLVSASTSVEYELEVTDVTTGHKATYFNPLGTLAPARADIKAFDTCP